MSARDDVLAAVRAALGPDRPPRTARPAAAPVSETGPVRAALVDLFAERVADYRATVTRTDRAGLEAAVVAAIDDATTVVVPDGLYLDIPHSVPGEDLTTRGLDGVDAVVTTATVGIAATGTIVLTHGPGQGRRALTLVPDHHVCVVTADQVVADVPDAVALLDPLRPQTWISGPSATSDIELNRVEGVHGPRRLDVVVVEG
jgi:L-lactate dehydrogenase complex protein LldG